MCAFLLTFFLFARVSNIVPQVASCFDKAMYLRMIRFYPAPPSAPAFTYSSRKDIFVSVHKGEFITFLRAKLALAGVSFPHFYRGHINVAYHNYCTKTQPQCHTMHLHVNPKTQLPMTTTGGQPQPHTMHLPLKPTRHGLTQKLQLQFKT